VRLLIVRKPFAYTNGMERKAVAYLGPSDELGPSSELELVAVVTGELADALTLLAEGRAQTLFVQRLHAVAASLGELARLLAWLEAYGLDLVSVQPPLDTSTRAGGRTVALLHEIDRWGREPDRPRRPRGRPGLGHAAPDVAERIASLRQQGLSLRAIADRLNAEGIPTPRGGATWRASSVQSAVGYQRPHPPAAGLPRPPGPPKHAHGPGPSERPPKPPRSRHRKPRPGP
jgi:DNA invertase Pin-like site-specific DNA recombinase